MLKSEFKVLIGCEYSGVFRDTFLKAGYNALSCDLLPTEVDGPHYQGDIFQCINIFKPHLLIAFPPCTYLSKSGFNFTDIKVHKEKGYERFQNVFQAANFFMKLYLSDVPYICIENPPGFINSTIMQPDQIINPYYFGEKEFKPTCLWLKNLPTLQHFKFNDLFGNEATHIGKPDPIYISKNGRKKSYFVSKFLNSPKSQRGHLRSKSFQSFADSMLIQFTNYFKSTLNLSDY